MHHLFSYEYNWKGIEFPAGLKDWKRFEKNNETIALNILQVPHNEIKISHAYKSEYNRKRKNQVVLLMITDGEKWHYIALEREPTDDGFNRPMKSQSKLFRGITSNHDGDFYYLNCLHSFRTDNAFKKHERLCENNDYYCVEMPTKLSDILDKLSEINNNKDCKTCIERKNIKSECEFIGFKNNRLNYRCKECNGTSSKSVNDLTEKFP